jgi:isoleucyl-tRNA synthetase
MNDSTQSFSFAQNEHQVLAFWQENQIFEKSLAKTKNMPVYAFYDGPPFATGLPHHGHLLASTIKDIIPRYFTMTGHYIERRFGWDCHGLPIEYEIDKQFGKSTADVVNEIGIAGYNDACRSIVQRYASQWRSTITRLGRWVDFDNDYKTMSPEFMESIWWVFQQLWDKGLIYRGTKIVPFSTALGTGLSNFEAGSNYQDVQDPAVIVLLPLKDEEASLAIWTTTPWTLPSNLGICVNANLDYVKVRDTEKNQTFYIAAGRHEVLSKKHSLEIISTYSGSDLVGKEYIPVFNYFSELSEQGAFRVFADDYVSIESGTGLVHMAPAFGEDDARIMASLKLDRSACPVDDAGCFTDEVCDFAGQYVKDADKDIIKKLKEQNCLYDHSTLVHSYPFCPRSDTPLIYRAIPSWYVAVEKIKDRLLANNEKINWTPSHIKHGRFGKWLAGARDWAISRNRVWGTPLPLWINDSTDKIICIGSVAELEQYSGIKVTDLHRDSVDDISFAVDNEPGTYRRITDVLDCWFESGSMPYAQQHYPFEQQDYFKQAFPAEFIAEGLDQTRGWFYTLTVLSTALFDQPAFKNVIVNGIVMARDGKKMSKRLKNYTAPDTLMEQYGADALRLYLINSGLVKAEEQRFSDDGVKEMVRQTLLPWLNAYKFFETYAKVDDWHTEIENKDETSILDRWIISRLQSVKQLVNHHMAGYRLYQVVPELLLFIDELTNIYIRLNRQRFWAPGMEADKQAAYTTLFRVLTEFTTCMAPFSPFLAETIYQKLQAFNQKKDQPESVHLCDYPIANTTRVNQDLEQGVARLEQILILGRQKRNDAKIKIKTPLRTLTIIHKDEKLLDEITKLEKIIKKELNIKNIRYEKNEKDYISLYAKPNSPVLGKRFQKRFAQFRKAIEQLGEDQINTLEAGNTITIDDEKFNANDILIFREAKAGTDVVTNRLISLELDITLDQELLNEGLAREIINRIQKTRKELDFNVDDRIKVEYETTEKLGNIIKQHSDYICHETLCTELKRSAIEKSDFAEELEGHPLKLTLTVQRMERT